MDGASHRTGPVWLLRSGPCLPASLLLCPCRSSSAPASVCAASYPPVSLYAPPCICFYLLMLLYICHYLIRFFIFLFPHILIVCLCPSLYPPSFTLISSSLSPFHPLPSFSYSFHSPSLALLALSFFRNIRRHISHLILSFLCFSSFVSLILVSFTSSPLFHPLPCPRAYMGIWHPHLPMLLLQAL